MSKMGQVVFEIEELYNNYHTPEAIARIVGVPLPFVMGCINTIDPDFYGQQQLEQQEEYEQSQR